jgi:hypothetical protein
LPEGYWLPVAHLLPPGDGIGVANHPCPFETAGWAVASLDTAPTRFVPTELSILIPALFFDAVFVFNGQNCANALLDKFSEPPLQ